MLGHEISFVCLHHVAGLAISVVLHYSSATYMIVLKSCSLSQLAAKSGNIVAALALQIPLIPFTDVCM